MLQDLTKTTNVPDQMSYAEPMRSVAKAAAPPDRCANDLMDEIFGDVEDVLDGGFVPPQEPVKVEVPAPEIKFDVAAALAERYPQLARHLDEGEALPDLPGPATALETSKEKAKKKKKEKDPNGLSLIERFMILTGCTSAVAALGIWMTSQGLLGRFGTVLSQQAAPVAPAPAVDSAQVKFADYMLRSMAAIDRTTAPAAGGPGGPGGNLPTVPVAALPGSGDNKPGATTATVGIVLPKPGNGAIASANALPNPTQANPQIVPIAPQSQPVAINPDTVSRSEFNRVNQMLQKISGMLERIAPGSSSRIPGLGNRTVAAPKVAAVAPAVAAPVANLPQRTMTSFGVLPNNNSFVIFELNGVAQRVVLGENVGSSGWTLIDVNASGVATFRRNGEIRNVSQGEKL